MKRKNQEIRGICDHDYPNWLWSRKKHVKAMPMNILAQFQPSKSYVEKDYANSPFLAEFHLTLLLHLDLNLCGAICFMYVFFPKARPRPIKSLAYDYNVDRDTIYQWAHETALRILSTAKARVKINEMMARNDFKFT